MQSKYLISTKEIKVKVEKILFMHQKSKIVENYESILVVADGVGGWNNLGVDPSLFSKELCEK